MSKVYVFLAEGFEEIEGLTVVDLLRRAKIDTEMVSVMEGRQITGSHGIKVTADSMFADVDFADADVLVLPGGMPGTLNLEANELLMSQVDAFYAQGKLLAAICAAPQVFGAQGVLEGKKATIYPSMEGCLKGAEPQDEIVVVDVKIITSMGPATAMPFALKLIEVLKGAEASEAVASGLLWNRL